MGQFHRPLTQILARLGEDGADLNPQNLTNWRGGGYLEWLRSQTQIDRLRLRQELASNLITATSGTPVHEASRLLVASQLWELFLEFDAEASLQNLQATPELYPRFVATLARLCEADTASARQKTQETRLKARLQQGRDSAAPGLITTGTLQNISTKLNLH